MRLRTVLIELLACLAMAAAAAADPITLEITEEQEIFWTEVISNSNFAELLDNATSGGAPWPEVVSSQYASAKLEPDLAAAQGHFRDLAVRLVESLDRFRSDFEKLDSKTFKMRTSQLLVLRTRLTERPSYINLLLADAINRVLFIEIAKYVVTHGEVDEGIEQQIATLGNFTVDVSTLADIVARERGSPVLLSDAGYENDVGMDPRDPRLAFHHLAEQVAGSAQLVFFAPQADVKAVMIFHLLSNRNLPNLLYRLWRSDHMIHIVLPLTTEYIQKAGSSSATSGRDKIRSTLGLSQQDRRAYDTDWHITQPTVISAIAHVLEDIDEGKIDDYATFSFRPASSAMSPHDKEDIKQ